MQYEIREVFYDESGRPTSWTAEPTCLAEDSVEDLEASFVLMMEAIKKPILVEDGDKLKEVK
jgi:hypothetical protein